MMKLPNENGNRSSNRTRTPIEVPIHTIGVSDTPPMCRKCEEIEKTLYHLLYECDSMTIQK